MKDGILDAWLMRVALWMDHLNGNAIIRLGDSAGVNKLILLDALGVEVASINSDGVASFAGGGVYLPLAGGTLTGNVGANAGVTLDGVDLSAFKSAYDTHTHAYLSVNGGTMIGVITSSVAGGTAPFVIASATKVANLNVDKIDDLHAAASGADAHALATDANGSISIVSVVASTAIGARVYHSAAQAIVTATPTALAFDSERFDTNAIHDTSTNNSRLTCKTAGVYVISASVQFAANATGLRAVNIVVNGSVYIAPMRFMAVTDAGNASLVTNTTIYQLAVNDYVQVLVQQNSGANLNVLANGNFSPEFSMVRIA